MYLLVIKTGRYFFLKIEKWLREWGFLAIAFHKNVNIFENIKNASDALNWVVNRENILEIW